MKNIKINSFLLAISLLLLSVVSLKAAPFNFITYYPITLFKYALSNNYTNFPHHAPMQHVTATNAAIYSEINLIRNPSDPENVNFFSIKRIESSAKVTGLATLEGTGNNIVHLGNIHESYPDEAELVLTLVSAENAKMTVKTLTVDKLVLFGASFPSSPITKELSWQEIEVYTSYPNSKTKRTFLQHGPAR